MAVDRAGIVFSNVRDRFAAGEQPALAFGVRYWNIGLIGMGPLLLFLGLPYEYAVPSPYLVGKASRKVLIM